MAATARKPGEVAELDQLRAEITELRAALRSVARLALGVAVTAIPHSPMANPPTRVTEVCRIHGVGENHARIIEGLFG